MPSQELSSTYGVEQAPRESASIFSILRRRALIIVVVTLLAGGASAAIAALKNDTYESTAKLLFRQTIGPELNAIGLLPGAPDADNLAADMVQVTQSKRVAVATSDRLRQRGIDESADDVQKDVTVFAPKDTEVVSVTATAGSAERAALLANIYSQEAQRLAQLDERRLAERALTRVQQQIKEVNAGGGGGDSRAIGDLREDETRLATLVDVGTGSPQIVQPGYVPSSATGNPIQTVVLGILLGLVLGVGLALLREQADRRLHRADQVSAAYSAPVLTTVPRHRKLKRARPFSELPPEIAEAFRMLQANLRFAGERPISSVLVTSSRSREGKTTVAWNLAAAAASAGLSVALVEADMRRPSMASRYGLDERPGLAEVLNGDASVVEALQGVAARGAGNTNSHPRRTDVMVAGQPPLNPSALMQSSVMLRVLDVLSAEHDLLIVDTPPVAHVADAISLLRHVDGVLVVAAVSSTRGPDASRLKDQLQSLDARLLGVVANGGSALHGYAYAPPSAGSGGGASGNGAGTGDPIDMIGNPPRP
jgi:succinoglycan biosynthesis transport protein ExoP